MFQLLRLLCVAATQGLICCGVLALSSSTTTGDSEGYFRSLVTSGLFVDKSQLIEAILERDEKVFQVTRPRKWGKTTNLQMVKHFFEIELDENGNKIVEENKLNKLLFQGGNIQALSGTKQLKPLKIATSNTAMEEFGKHPVIYMDLKEVNGDEKSMVGVIVKLFSSYPFLASYLDNSSELLDDDEKLRLSNFLKGSLQDEYVFDFMEFLSMILYEHFESYVCIFIDNYDFPIINTFLKFGDRGPEFEHVVETFRRFYDYTFKENQYILKAMVTGTLNLDLVPSGSSEFEYRYIAYSSLLDSTFSEFYGFSTEEVIDLLHRSGSKLSIKSIKEWYGGITLNRTEISNPQSVMKAIFSGNIKYYLTQGQHSELASFLERAFVRDEMQDQLHLLSEGKEIIVDSIDDSTPLKHLTRDFCSVFVHVGYLRWVLPERVTEKPIWRVRIPNLEIRGVVASGLRKWVEKELNISSSEYNNFSNLLFSLEIGKFVERLQYYLTKLEKYNVKTEENCYHNLMGGIAASLGVGHLVDSIKEYGSNRGEHVITPLPGHGQTTINIEYNTCKPWQKIEDIVKASLEDLLHRPKACRAKIRVHDHVKSVMYVSVGLVGPAVIEKHKLVSLS